jgi:hypothetical protein
MKTSLFDFLSFDALHSAGPQLPKMHSVVDRDQWVSEVLTAIESSAITPVTHVTVQRWFERAYEAGYIESERQW